MSIDVKVLNFLNSILKHWWFMFGDKMIFLKIQINWNFHKFIDGLWSTMTMGVEVFHLVWSIGGQYLAIKWFLKFNLIEIFTNRPSLVIVPTYEISFIFMHWNGIFQIKKNACKLLKKTNKKKTPKNKKNWHLNEAYPIIIYKLYILWWV